MGITNQKGGVETGLPNDNYRGGYDKIAWQTRKPMCVCKWCGHDMDKCACVDKEVLKARENNGRQ